MKAAVLSRRTGPGSAVRPTGGAGWPMAPGAVAAAIVLAVIMLAAVWPSLLATHPPEAVDSAQALAGPSSAHWFGTDHLGRDLYSRVVYGAGPSLLLGLGATAIAVGAGSLLAMLAIIGGRIADEIVMRLTDVFLAFPGILLALLVVAVLGPGTLNATVAIGCAFVPGFTRLVRGEALVVRESGYVRAAVTFGHRRVTIYVRHVLPNALPPLLALSTLTVGTAVLAGSSLSFLGLGPQPPSPEWGAMLAEGRDFVGSAWALAVFPGAALTTTVIAVNIVGRELRRRFEGRRPGGRR